MTGAGVTNRTTKLKAALFLMPISHSRRNTSRNS